MITFFSFCSLKVRKSQVTIKIASHNKLTCWCYAFDCYASRLNASRSLSSVSAGRSSVSAHDSHQQGLVEQNARYAQHVLIMIEYVPLAVLWHCIYFVRLPFLDYKFFLGYKYVRIDHRHWFHWTAVWLQLHVSLVHVSACSFTVSQTSDLVLVVW